MKKILKSCVLVLVAVCVAFSFVGCKNKISDTTVNTDNVKKVNGISTNGGMTVIHDDYLYFINGTKENDGTNKNDNKRAAICRVRYDALTGETSGNVEVVISDFVGFDNGSINIFGDFLYYTTPCANKNYKGEVLYNEVCFKRYDLVNKKSYELYSTQLNDSEEKVSFAYYVVEDSLNLVVYETKCKTIRSFKIDTKVSENYVINGVTGCLLSENYGKAVTTNETVDANSFVFYTKDTEKYDSPNTGVKVYKTSPVKDNSALISQGKTISLVSIRSGKLLFTYNEFVYCQKITAKTDESLVTDNTNCISRENFENAIYLENYSVTGKNETAKLEKAEGHISILYFDKDNYYFKVFEWDSNLVDNDTTITKLSSASSFSFIGLATLEEDDPDNEGEKIKFLNVIYTESNLVYKLQIAKVVDENNLSVTQFSEPVKLSETKVSEISGILVPEITGNFLFVLAKDDKENEYIYKVDLTPTKTVNEDATKISIDED